MHSGTAPPSPAVDVSPRLCARACVAAFVMRLLVRCLHARQHDQHVRATSREAAGVLLDAADRISSTRMSHSSLKCPRPRNHSLSGLTGSNALRRGVQRRHRPPAPRPQLPPRQRSRGSNRAISSSCHARPPRQVRLCVLCFNSVSARLCVRVHAARTRV